MASTDGSSGEHDPNEPGADESSMRDRRDPADDAGSDRHDEAGVTDRSAADARHGIVRLHDDPQVHEPVLIVQLDGWIDASEAAKRAADALDQACETTPVLRFDDDTYIDFRARRPILELRDGLSTDLVWSQIELRAGRAPDGTDVLVLRGPEPDMAWNRFGRAVATLAEELGVTQMVAFGAYPFASPHTRRSRLSVSSPSLDVLARVPFLRSSVDVPAGVEALLEHALHAARIPTIGLWAQVPHYAAGTDYPDASIALLDGLAEVTSISVPTTALAEDAALQRTRLDEKLAESPELRALLANLEDVWDRTVEHVPDGEGDAASDPELELRSGDELAAEIQQFLRDRD
ncbi:MAG: PAC2 family protein [Actinomycetota bacterium]